MVFCYGYVNIWPTLVYYDVFCGSTYKDGGIFCVVFYHNFREPFSSSHFVLNWLLIICCIQQRIIGIQCNVIIWRVWKQKKLLVQE